MDEEEEEEKEEEEEASVASMYRVISCSHHSSHPAPSNHI